MKQYIKWFAAIAVVGALAGCARTAPIDQVHTSVSAGHTQDQVKTAILKAGIQRQWVMSEVGPGVIKARQQTRDHVAEVRITYTATSYDIKYDAALTCRHLVEKFTKNYNRWVRNLDKDIQLNLSAGANL